MHTVVNGQNSDEVRMLFESLPEAHPPTPPVSYGKEGMGWPLLFVTLLSCMVEKDTFPPWAVWLLGGHTALRVVLALAHL